MTSSSIEFIGGVIAGAIVLVMLVAAASWFIYSFFYSADIPDSLAFKLDSLANRLNHLDGEDSFLFQIENSDYSLLALGKGNSAPVTKYPFCKDEFCICLWKVSRHSSDLQTALLYSGDSGYCVPVETRLVDRNMGSFVVSVSEPSVVEITKETCPLAETLPCFMVQNLKEVKGVYVFS